MIASPNQFDEFDIEIPEEPMPKLKSNHGVSDRGWNRFAWFFLIGTAVLMVFFTLIFINPNGSLNPFPPIEIPPTVIIPTGTSTNTLAPTWTFSPQPTRTHTPVQTEIPLPVLLPSDMPDMLATTAGENSVIAVSTADPTITPVLPTATVNSGGYSFIVQPGSPAAVSSSIMRPDDGCSWMGVGGQVVDLQGAPIVGLRVQLYGSLHGKIKAITSLTGTVNRYGPAGYEITIADTPTASSHTLWLQLFNQSGGAISDKVYFNTYDDCEKNLTIIHFKQVK